MLYLWVLALLMVLERALGHGHHFAFPQNQPRDLIRSPYSYNYEVEEPSGKHLHKIKKLRKKQLLLCLLGGGGGGGRNIPDDSPEAKFLFPVLQQTEVNVGGPGYGNNHLSSAGYSGGGGGMNCDSLLSNGGGGGLLSHPLLGSLGGLGGGNKPTTDEDENRFNHFNMKRYVVRPLYKSMKAFYRLFR